MIIMAESKCRQNPLEKYKTVGEDHPSYHKLKEALARGQDAVVQEAISELEALKQGGQAQRPAPSERKRSFPLWNLLWVVLLSAALTSAALVYVNRHVREIIARNPPPSNNQFLFGEVLGGAKSQAITCTILKELEQLKPDTCLFVGHQLAKKEVVEYLSALSRIAKVQLVIGKDANGKSQMASARSPLRQYQFTDIREAPLIIRTQVLLAFNNKTKRAVAFIGTYPFDVQDASSNEHALMVLRDYNECSQLYGYYAKLLSSGR
jgi:hypothetical protein